MPFNTDYSEVKEGTGGIMPIGEYEAIIKYAGEDTTKSGTVYINVTVVIRNDVEQKFKNKYLWHKIWHRKEPTPADIALGGYSSKQIMSLSKAAGLPNNQKYESLSDWGDQLKNKPVRITIEHENDLEGRPREKVQWVNESRCLPCNHVWKTEAPRGAVNVNANDFHDGKKGYSDYKEIIEDDGDLPF